MFDKEIEFSAHEDYFALKEDYPTPIKLNIPEWYKKLGHDINNKTVKGCMPFLDSLTAGYLLKMPQDFYVKHNVDNKNEKGEEFKDCFIQVGLEINSKEIHENLINLNIGSRDYHSINQLKGSELLQKNKNLPFYKILNPWKIKTPRGYSCLFVPPLNNGDDRFSIIPGIVDTDVFPMEINFPILINGDKYPILETVIKKGTPYVQIIPFKRDSWKMTLQSKTSKKIKNNMMFHGLKILNAYKDNYWNKKSWK
jgi:hypothetical protein